MGPAQWLVAMPNAVELDGDKPPEWILLMPGGESFAGRDGRGFRSPGAQAVIAAHASRPDIPIDVNHSEITRALRGEPSPAVGWVRELADRSGELWGRVEWNQAGVEAIVSRKYRYHSPVYIPGGGSDIAYIHSVGLVNSPNLYVPPLSNREERMNVENILQALGLPAAATEQEALAAIKKLANTASADGAVVPRADYDLMADRAKAAEQKVRDRDAQDLRAAAEAAVDGAVKSGKVAPASRDYYLSNCADPEGLQEFKKFAETAPALVTGGAEAPAGSPQTVSASAEEAYLNRQFGLEPEAGAGAGAGDQKEKK